MNFTWVGGGDLYYTPVVSPMLRTVSDVCACMYVCVHVCVFRGGESSCGGVVYPVSHQYGE